MFRAKFVTMKVVAVAALTLCLMASSGDCVESASPGTVFALSGVASAGSTFAGFTGDADCTDGSVTLTANTTCTADFTLNPPPTFTLTVTGTGTGTGTVTGTGISCTSTAGVTSGDCADGPVASGTLFAVTASPSAGSTFGTWGGCDSTAANVCNVTLTADRTVTATFGGRSVPGTGVRDTHYLPLNLDGSGRSATIAYNAIAGGATVFGENGAVSATAIVNAAVAHPWSSGWTIKPGDFNGDGRTDLLFYNAASGAVFKAISDGAFGFTYVGTSWSADWDIAVMNLNGDALDDVFLYNTATGQHFRGTSAGAGTGDFTYVGGAWSPNWQVHTTYLNDDGITDLFLYNVTQGTWFRALNDGANGFTYVSGSWSPEWQVYPADYTGDGLTDVFLYNTMTGGRFVARNTGTGWAYTGGTWSPGWTVRPGDFSGDGIIDLFLYNGVTGTYFVSVSDGAGGFAHSGATLSPGWQTFVTTFNLDALADIFVLQRRHWIVLPGDYDDARELQFLRRHVRSRPDDYHQPANPSSVAASDARRSWQPPSKLSGCPHCGSTDRSSAEPWRAKRPTARSGSGKTSSSSRRRHETMGCTT